jgi:hypothetical protein
MPESPFDLGFNPTKNFELVPTSIGRRAAVVVPSDTNLLPFAAMHIYVGTGGDVRLLTMNGDDVTYKNKPSGTYIDIVAQKIFDTGTTAKDLLIDG